MLLPAEAIYWTDSKTFGVYESMKHQNVSNFGTQVIYNHLVKQLFGVIYWPLVL